MAGVRQINDSAQSEILEESRYCPLCGGANAVRDVEGHFRPMCQQCGHVTYLDPKLAVGVIVEQDGRILLGIRGEGTREAGKWSIPAGFVERGEAVESAAVREVLEETGLRIRLSDLVGVYSETGETVALVVYSGLALGGHLHADDDLEELGWFAIDALPELAFARDAGIFLDWKRRNAGDRSRTDQQAPP